MQVSGSLASSVSLSFAASNVSRPEAAPEALAPEVKFAPAAGAESPDPPAPSRFDGMRETVEGLLARLQAGQGGEVEKEDERVQGHHHHGEEHELERTDRHEQRDLRKQLKNIEHAVRDELKDFRKELDDPEMRHEVKRLNHDFRHELRHLAHDIGHGEGLDGTAVAEDVRGAFEGLVSRLQGMFGEEPPVEGPVDAGALVESGEVAPLGVEVEPMEPVEPGETGDEAPGVAVEEAPVEPIEGVDEPVAIEVPAPADPAVGLRDFLQSMTARFESMLGELEALMPAPEDLIGEATNALAGATEARFEMAFSVFSESSLSFTVEEPGTQLDLAG